jgi:hypothetical protein
MTGECDNSSQYEDIDGEGQYIDEDGQEYQDQNSQNTAKLLKQKLKLND